MVRTAAVTKAKWDSRAFTKPTRILTATLTFPIMIKIWPTSRELKKKRQSQRNLSESSFLLRNDQQRTRRHSEDANIELGLTCSTCILRGDLNIFSKKSLLTTLQTQLLNLSQEEKDFPRKRLESLFAASKNLSTWLCSTSLSMTWTSPVFTSTSPFVTFSPKFESPARLR